MRAARRAPLMALGAVSFLTGLWAGLARLGWTPATGPAVPPDHGPLMVSGFLGTVIGLERAVALGRRWPYAAPVLAGLGGLALLSGVSVHVAHALAASAALVLVAIFVALLRAHPSTHLATMTVGAACWLVGTLVWHGGDALYRVVPWWVGFLVLTIAGERRELSRLARLPRWMDAAFWAAATLLLVGLVLTRVAFSTGVRVSGAGLVALALWLLRGDIAWRTLARPGAPRFMAVCLLSGHLWLALGGVLWLVSAPVFAAGPSYDAMLHSIFLGFVFSMIFGHAIIILPSVLGVALPYRPAFYAHWAVLQLSLLARIGADLALWLPGQRWAGLGNAAALVLFLANTIRAVRAGGGDDAH